MPASFVFRTNQGKAYTADTYFIFGKPAPVTINSVVASASPFIYPVTTADVSGTSITNGINYKVLSFASVSTTTSYTVNYTCASATTIYVLAVGGGGSGGYGGAGGGGGGGVVMNPISIPSGSGTINISVGAGGSGITTATKLPGITGNTTTVNFSSNPSANILAYGGGGGGQDNNIGAINGSSSGGNGASVTTGTTISSVPPITNNYNYGNYGGGNPASGSYGAGGGGAGTVGMNSISSTSGGTGGSGIQCFLPGITTFSPSGTTYGTYYWAGGGGGAADNTKIGGNGGIGGGGGGGVNNGSSGISTGGTGGINSGGVGNGTNGGNGGANTGSGGGGLWNNGTISGAGGSGIVIIAFPSATAVSSNQAAVLPASIVSSGLYSATLNNATLSSLAYNSIKGAFACRLLNYNYFGPVMTLRHSADTYGNNTQNFYADVFGNLGTQYLGTGQSVSAWLSANSANTTYAYVTKWYNQGMDASFNSATQYNINAFSMTVPAAHTINNPQPIYDVSYGVINFGFVGSTTSTGNYVSGWSNSQSTSYSNANSYNPNSFFYLPDNALPRGDSAYTYTMRHWNTIVQGNGSTYGYSTFVSGGGSGGNGFELGIWPNTGVNQYSTQWWGTNNYSNATVSPNNVITQSYAGGGTGNTLGTAGLAMYVNNVANIASSGSNSNSRAQLGVYNFIGISSWTDPPANAQLYNMFVFSTALSTADRTLIEATPYTYSASATTTIAGLAATNITSTNFSLSWTALASPNYYILWVNGSMYGSYTAGSAGTYTTTITPGVSGPWTVNLYAYNSSNVLLASGTTNSLLIASVTNNGFPATFFPFWSNTTNYATNANDGSTFGTACVYTSATGYKAGVGSLSQPTVTGGFLTNPITYTSGAAISFGGWFNMTSSGIFCHITMNGGSNRYFLNNSTGINLAWNGVGVLAAQGASSSAFTSYTNGTWIHIIVVIPSSGNTVAYVNGSLVATPLTSTTISPGSTFTNVNTVLFGYNGPSAGVSGNINNFYIFQRALSATEVTALYNQ